MQVKEVPIWQTSGGGLHGLEELVQYGIQTVRCIFSRGLLSLAFRGERSSEAAEAGCPAERQGSGQGESTRFRSATAEPLAGRTGIKQTSGTTPHTGGALGNLNLIGRVRGRKLALSATAPGYKELEVQVKEVCVCEAMKSPVGT